MENCHYRNTADFVEIVAKYIEDDTLPKDELYTTTFFIPQSIIFNADKHSLFQISLEQLQPLVDDGKVRYAHFQDVAEEWRTTYDSRPNIVLYEVFKESDRTCGSD